MEIEEDIKTLGDYLRMARRRKYLILIPLLTLLAITIVVAIALPPVYSSEATILIEQQHIPTDLVKSTVTSLADERIKQIEQKVMTVDNINKIIEKYNLYESLKTKLSISELAVEFKEKTELTLVNANVIKNGRNNTATLAFKLSFSHKKAAIAQKITSELVTLYLDENIRNRTERAEETTLFLAEEAKKFKLEIQKIENKIAEYKEEYSDSLPELLPVNLSSIERIESELQQLEFRGKLLTERKVTLRTQLAATSLAAISPSGTSAELIQESLPELKERYKLLLNKYSKSHPDVRAIKRKIRSYRKGSGKSSRRISNPVYLQLQGEMDIAQIELKDITLQKISLKERLKQFELRVSQTHQVERGYYDLMRDLENNRDKYKELKSKSLEAGLSQTLEEEQKAEKFSLLEPARIPLKPEKPNRFKILVMGFALSVFAGLGTGFLAEMLDGSIRGYNSLTQLTGIEPLVIIPYIENDADLARTQKNKKNFMIVAAALFVGTILALHFFYMSLDLLWLKFWHRIAML